MAHVLIEQLRFAKEQWLAGHEALKNEDGEKRLGNANSISWMVGHLADFDQAVWLEQRTGRPALNEAVKACSYGQPATVPHFSETLEAWHAIQTKVDEVLEAVTAADLSRPHGTTRTPAHESLAALVWRQTWHYWYHLGEMQAVRQALGHEDLVQYIGRIPEVARWTPQGKINDVGLPHLLVQQTRFAKREWLRGHEDLQNDDAIKRLGHANSMSWMVGHLAAFDQAVWLQRPRGIVVNEAVNSCGYGRPASTPNLTEMLNGWHEIQAALDPVQETLTDDDLLIHPGPEGNKSPENIGTLMLRQMWHYWYHLGEMQGVRQMLGHEDLAQFVGLVPAESAWNR